MKITFERMKDRLHETNTKIKWSASHERGTKKKSVSLTGFKPMTTQTLGERSIHLSYGELLESEAIY